MPTNTWFLSKLRTFETMKCYRHNIGKKCNLRTVWEANSFNTYARVLLTLSDTAAVNEQIYKQALKHSS